MKIKGYDFNISILLAAKNQENIKEKTGAVFINITQLDAASRTAKVLGCMSLLIAQAR